MSIAGVRTPHVAEVWTSSIVESLSGYIRIPCVAPTSRPGPSSAIDRALEHIRGVVPPAQVAGLTVERIDRDRLTPLLLMEAPAFGAGSQDRTVLLYGHLDKQPEMEGWFEGFGPWDPRLVDGRLYGRDGGDDGYAAPARRWPRSGPSSAGGSHHQAVIVIEASEESGSIDLPAHLEACCESHQRPELVICLDGGSLDYGRLWVTSSLRPGRDDLGVDVLDEGVHSGEASGVVPSRLRASPAAGPDRGQRHGTGPRAGVSHADSRRSRRRSGRRRGRVPG
ncbi:MAG: hypothetical protein R2705_22870 [Ilumatobacteraceae bacterium]